jgi:hypothetical protein
VLPHADDIAGTLPFSAHAAEILLRTVHLSD